MSMKQPNVLRPVLKIFALGSWIAYRAVYQAIVQEIELSRQAAQIRYEQRLLDKGQNSKKLGVTLEEAMRILNVSTLDGELVEKRFSSLFEANQPAKGGTFYILSKIVRAKKRLDLELAEKELRNQAYKT